MTEHRPEVPDTPEEFPRTVEEIRADRDLTREELGQTVSELADKVDIPARAEDRLHEIADTTRQRTAEASHRVAATAERAKSQAGRLAEKVSLSEPVEDVGKQVADSARRHRVPVAVVAAGSAAVITWFVLRRRRS